MGNKGIAFPPMYRIKKYYQDSSIEDVAGAVRERFDNFDFKGKIQPGKSVAIAVGSRGIRELSLIVKTVVQCLQERGLRPYIIPAMGSHGGATGEGQAQVLAELGITESSVGVSVVSSMDVASLGILETGGEVFFAKDALIADQVVIINRVKPHTAFRGEVESGLCKMLSVGCGKQAGASMMHKFDLARTIVPAAHMILEKAPVLCGLAVTENALGGIQSVTLASPDAFADIDRELLKETRELLPKLPLDDLDILIVNEMGKDVSGAGMDPNVIGFWRREGGPRKPDFRTIVVLDLTDESHGNAIGIGMADLTTRRVMDKIDLEATYMNALTSRVLRSARLPIALDNDRDAIETALNQGPDPLGMRVVRIVNTGKLGAFWGTELVARELRAHKGISIDDTPLTFAFDEQNRLLPFGD